jgi:phosphoenolpyruvate-protein kinase (PTS system EI component)
MIAAVIREAKRCGRKIGICGQAPSDYPEFAEFLIDAGIDSISLNPDAVLKTTARVLDVERAMEGRARSFTVAETKEEDDVESDATSFAERAQPGR